MLLNFTITFGQENIIKFETFYKNNPDLKFEEEHYEFELSKGILTKYDADLNEKLEYFVSFMDSSYTKGNQFYFVCYNTNIEQYKKNENKTKLTDYELGMYCLMYDKKLGNILGIKIYSSTNGKLQNETIYLTKLGREKMKFIGE